MKYLLLIVLGVSLLYFTPKPISLVHAQSMSELQDKVIFGKLQEEFNKLPEDAGALIILPGGKTFSKNPDQQFPSYSVIKLWIAATAYDLNSKGSFPLNAKTLQLIEAMLENSDNNATNALIDELGGFDAINSFISEKYGSTVLRRKMLDTPSEENDNFTSPSDAVKFMRDLEAGSVVNARSSLNIIEFLKRRTETGSDPFKPNSVLPASVEFRGKSGILGEGRNDVGSFLDNNGKRVFFAIFIPSGGTASETLISNLEQLMYNPSVALSATTPGTTTQLTGPARGSRVCIKVGEPTEAMPEICNTPTFGTSSSGAASSGGNSTIVSAAAEIVNTLAIGTESMFNAKTDEPGVYYWCTFLIADAYNKAGISGVTRSAHAAVVTMKAFFASTEGFSLFPPETPAEQLAPGDVVFFEGNGQHVSLIKSVTLNEEGNGAIHTYDSNNVVTEDVITVVNHKAQRANSTARLYAITGFGRAVK